MVSHAIVDRIGFMCWAISTKGNGAAGLSYNVTIIGVAGKCKTLEKMLHLQPARMTKPALSPVCISMVMSIFLVDSCQL